MSQRPHPTVTVDEIADALAFPTEMAGRRNAAAWLLSTQREWLADAEFRGVLHLDVDERDSTLYASVDWAAAARFMNTDRFATASDGEQAMLEITISLAGETRIALGEMLVDLDEDNLRHVLAAVAWAAGHRELGDQRLGVAR